MRLRTFFCTLLLILLSAAPLDFRGVFRRRRVRDEAARFFVGVFLFTTFLTAAATRFLMPLEEEDLPTDDLDFERVAIFTFTTLDKK